MSMDIYDRTGNQVLGRASIYDYSLSFEDFSDSVARKEWLDLAGVKGGAQAPVDLAKPSIAFLLSEIKKAKKALAKRR